MMCQPPTCHGEHINQSFPFTSARHFPSTSSFMDQETILVLCLVILLVLIFQILLTLRLIISLHSTPHLRRKDEEENTLGPSCLARRDCSKSASIVSAPSYAYAASSVYSGPVPESNTPVSPSRTGTSCVDSLEHIESAACENKAGRGTRPPSRQLERDRKEEIVMRIFGRNCGSVVTSQPNTQN